MTETPKSNPENQENDFLKDAKKIYLEWKEADKTYNSKGITNKNIRKKYLEYKKRYEDLKTRYENLKVKTKNELSDLKLDIKKMKEDNIKDYKIKTIASIIFYLEKDNKKLGFDKIIQNLNLGNSYKNVNDIYSNKDKLITVIKKLKGKEGKNEKQLLAYLEPILIFYNFKDVKIDISKNGEDRKALGENIRNFSKQEKIYNKNYKEYKKEKNQNKKINNKNNFEYKDEGLLIENEGIKEEGGNYYIENDEGKNIEITEEESKILLKKPELKENIIEGEKEMRELDIPFAWKQRKNLIPEMKKYFNFSEDENTKENIILTKNGIKNYLQFLIMLTGEKKDYSNSNINEVKAKIREINKDSIVGENVNIDSGFKPFGQKLIQNGIFNRFGVFNSFSAKNKIDKIFGKK